MSSGSGGGSMPGGSMPTSGTGGGYTPTGDGCGCGDPSGGLTCSGNDTVNTGRYTITSTNQNGGTTTIKDNETGVTDTISGDPHLSSSNGQAGEFQSGPLTIQLADGTDVEIVPTAKNSSGVATTSQVIVTKGQGAVILTGQQSSSGVTSSGVLDGGGSVMQNNFPADTVLTQGNNGTLYQTDQNGQATTAIGDNPSTDLDNLGGTLAGGNGVGGTGGGSGQNGQIMNMIQEILQMIQQLMGQQGQSSASGRRGFARCVEQPDDGHAAGDHSDPGADDGRLSRAAAAPVEPVVRAAWRAAAATRSARSSACCSRSRRTPRAAGPRPRRRPTILRWRQQHAGSEIGSIVSAVAADRDGVPLSRA